MVTGKTGEKILMDGLYICHTHPSKELYLIKDDTFPHCSWNDNHETTWELNNNSYKQAKEEESEESLREENSNQKKETNDAKEPVDIDKLYKKKGFFAAINYKNDPETDDYKIQSIIRDEASVVSDHINEIRDKHTNRLEVVRKELDALTNLIEEKQDIKKEFLNDLDTMQNELNEISSEIKKYYIDLRDQIKELGSSKEDLIEKRIDKFKDEIDKIISTYQNIENNQNNKFKKDFDDRTIKAEDKKFYFDYRDQLTSSFQDVQLRVKALEREGLNHTIANFLIYTGWVAAFVSSWFFVLWYLGDEAAGSSGLIIYIFDNLRYFILGYDWWISTLVFLGYICIVLFVAKYCYRRLIAAKFIIEKNEKQTKADKKEEIEFNPEKENLFNAQFKATNWYEMWLKIAPFITFILLLLIILALGSRYSLGINPALKNKITFQSLSDSISLQLIGLLLPISTTSIFFLYITKVVESREDKHLSTEQQMPKKGKTNWEIILSVILFITLIAVLLFYKQGSQILSKSQVGAWGFFIGCLCTGLSLGYGYRFISLNETYDVLVLTIDRVNRYIDRMFYPFEASYLKDIGILYRTKQLYHSLLDLVESRNNLAVRLLNPYFKIKREDGTTREENKPGNEEGNDSGEEEQNKKTEEATENPIKNLFKNIAHLFNIQERRWKEVMKERDKKIKELEDRIADIKKDSMEIEDLTYFPEAAGKAKELKILIEERTKRLNELKEELNGYYKNERTYASLNQQLDSLYTRQNKLAKSIEESENETQKKLIVLQIDFAQKKNLIEEGYHLGLWYHSNTYSID